MSKLRTLNSKRQTHTNKGFTLVELLIVAMAVGIMAVIAIPSWMAFLQRQQLNQMSTEISMLLRKAQHLAKKNNQSYIIDFQMNQGLPQYSLYANNATSPPWQNLTEQTDQITLDLAEGNQIVVNHDGSLHDLSPIRSGDKITLFLTNTDSSPKYCIMIRTILGATEIAQDSQCD
ncbi:MAG: Tfp pilus assembly protein FimT/FimU [Microcystaceae cyanobacterium]